jgi:Family of unknown function (DUF6459)
MDTYRSTKAADRTHPYRSATKFSERPRAAISTAHAPAVTTAAVTTAIAATAIVATPAVAAAADIESETGLEPPVGLLDPASREHPPPRLRLLRYEPDPARPAPPQPPTAAARRPHVVPEDHPDAADLRRHVERVLRLALEVLDGRRPLTQLTPHLTPSTVRYMRAALAGRPPLREPSRMTSLRLGRPHTGVAEVAVVYRRGPRARALAARFERVRPGSAPTRGPRAMATRTDPCAAARPEWRCVTLRLL